MSKLLRKIAISGAVTLGLLGGAALAQVPRGAELEPPPADSVLTGVTVSIPKTIETQRYGIVTQELTMSVRVPYGDLDLNTPAGVAELDRRVQEGATYVCGQLESMYPTGTPQNYICSRDAIRGAQPQVVLARGP